MIFGLQFLFWRELLPTGGIWKCFPCRRQIRKSGLLRLFWKLKLIKMFILAPVAKTQQGRKSSIRFYESVIIPTKLCVTCSASAPGLPHLLKHLPCMGAFSRTVLNANLRQQGSPPPPKDHGAWCHLPLPIDSPLSEAESAFLSAAAETRDTEGRPCCVTLSQGLEHLGFWYLRVGMIAGTNSPWILRNANGWTVLSWFYLQRYP